MSHAKDDGVQLPADGIEGTTELSGAPPVVPEVLRTWAYISGTAVLVFATSVGDAIPDPWGRLLTGYGAAALALAVGYRPTRR